MEKGTKMRQNDGFMLVEMLVVAAISVVLMAVGFVEVARTSRALKIQELDNMARAIYMAAENRAVTLFRSGRLTATVEESVAGGNGGVLGGTSPTSGQWRYIRYTPAPAITENMEDLLPSEAVDPKLRDGGFYIVYEVYSGCVTDVFYAEGKEKEGIWEDDLTEVLSSFPGGFTGFYEEWMAKTTDLSSRKTRADSKTYVGHYGGGRESAAMRPAPDKEVLLPALIEPEIEILNGDELRVKVSYQEPSIPKANDVRELHATLSYQAVSGTDGIELNLDTAQAVRGERQVAPSADGTLMKETIYVWTLDTLCPQGNAKQFKNLLPTEASLLGVGGDFKIDAKLTRAVGNAEVNAYPKTGNSLFADGSSGSIARIANLRHLQNLDVAFSGVKGKNYAVQVADIRADTAAFGTKIQIVDGSAAHDGALEHYIFKSIENRELTGYNAMKAERERANGADAPSYSISNLNVTQDSVKYADASGIVGDGKKGGAGLFAAAGEDGGSPFTFSFVSLVDASVCNPEDEEIPTGALVGTARGEAVFTSCKLNYANINGVNLAGGLAGKITVNGTLIGCKVGEEQKAAYVNISGGTCAGGLIGIATGNLTIEDSYADCYLKGQTVGKLIGALGEPDVSGNDVIEGNSADFPDFGYPTDAAQEDQTEDDHG